MSKDNFDIREWQLYQMFLNESEDDDWSINEPSQEWNVEDLTVGSVITPDMWDNEVKELSSIPQFKIALTTPLTIKAIFPQDLGGHPGYIMDFTNGISIHSSFLKPTYHVFKELNENEDEDWTVDNPSPEWNMKLLSIGDTITPDMWDLNNSDLDNYVDNPNEDWIIDEVDGEDIEISTKVWGGEFWGRLKDINSILKPGYRIVQNKDLFEEEDDEWTVDNPSQEWNVEYLTTGDIIMPEMWNQDKLGRRHFFEKPIKIGEIGYNEFDDYEEELLVSLDLGGMETEYDINFINLLLKPEYKVVQKKLNESEDEDWTVDNPSHEWNIADLEVGSVITPEMWNVSDPDVRFNFKRHTNYLDRPHTIEKIEKVKVKGKKYYLLRFDDGSSEYSFHLNKEYQRVKGEDIFESDEDWTVNEPSQAWNVTDLGVGDVITPDMWDDNKHGYGFGFIGTLIHEPIKIVGFDEDSDGKFVKLQKSQSTWQKIRNKQNDIVELDISEVNDELKSQFRIVYPINETKLSKLLEIDDEDWDVDNPSEEWNVTELSKGDIIIPDMWNDDINWTHDIRIEGFKPFSDGSGYMVYLKHLPPSSFLTSQVFTLDEVNSWLKNKYMVVFNGLNESDDEWAVDNPSQEWNVEVLGIGSILDSSNLKMQNHRKKFEIVDFKSTRFGDLVSVKVFELVEEPIPGTRRTTKQWKHTRNLTNMDLKMLNDSLKDNFKIMSPLSENDDDWTVNNPSEEWNYDYWEPNKDMNDDEIYESFIVFVSNVLKKKGVKEQHIDLFLDEIFHFGEIENYEGISSGDLFDDFQQWVRIEDEDSEWYDNMDESDDDWTVDNPSPEWNHEDFTGKTQQDFEQWVNKILHKNYDLDDDDIIEAYLTDIFYGTWDADFSNITERTVLKNFDDWMEEQDDDYGLDDDF